MKEREHISRILRVLPREKAFYFFTSIGNYTGESASSLREFVQKINSINVKSLEFHFYRGDFERWIADALEDNILAEELKKIQKLNLKGESLRAEIYKTVLKRYMGLNKLHRNFVSGSRNTYF